MRILTVTELTTYLRELFDSDEIVRDVWVEGEVSNFNRHSSGHCYFTLKQGEAQIGAACWRSSVVRIGTMPSNGVAVLAHGRVAFYEARGQTQLYVDDIRPAGIGLLQAQFERLKARLEAEGLFEASRKRTLPELPRRIGVVTSPTGAALQDILTVLARRYPLADVLVSPCKVQGAGSAETIVEALYALYETDVDVIIVARGGGAAEDLWAFNDEIVARAAFASPVPLISGVGHETDTTIIDYVADVRAATPSAAAELVAPHRDDLVDMVSYLRDRLESALDEQLSGARSELALAWRRLELRSPAARIERDRQLVDELARRAETSLGHRAQLQRAQLEGLAARLASLSPRAILGRGYAVVRHADGRLVTEPGQASPGDQLRLTLHGGDLAVRVEG
jgi:exodeoxyribonuclease VII large subunit